MKADLLSTSFIVHPSKIDAVYSFHRKQIDTLSQPVWCYSRKPIVQDVDFSLDQNKLILNSYSRQKELESHPLLKEMRIYRLNTLVSILVKDRGSVLSHLQGLDGPASNFLRGSDIFPCAYPGWLTFSWRRRPANYPGHADITFVGLKDDTAEIKELFSKLVDETNTAGFSKKLQVKSELSARFSTIEQLLTDDMAITAQDIDLQDPMYEGTSIKLTACLIFDHSPKELAANIPRSIKLSSGRQVFLSLELVNDWE